MRIAISSRNRIFREGLACILKERLDCKVVATARTAKECLAVEEPMRPEVIVIDRAEASETDIDYIMGAKLFGQFGLVLIADKGDEIPGL